MGAYEIVSVVSGLKSIEVSSELEPVMAAVLSIARCAEEIQEKLVSDAPWDYAEVPSHNQSGDKQTLQDVFAHNKFKASLTECSSVGRLVSEEEDGAVSLGNGNLSVTLDPFDGSKAYEFGIPPGTIFGIFEKGHKPSDFSAKGILAAGVFIYRHSLELVVRLGDSVLSINSMSTTELTGIPSRRSLVCCNLSNISKWGAGWRSYFLSHALERTADDKHNLRWYGSLATHFGVILRSGGLFAYPPDTRVGFENGHLRLLYEAIPISFIVDSLGGGASTGSQPILSIVPDDFHQKTPFVFGEATMVSELEESIREDQSK